MINTVVSKQYAYSVRFVVFCCDLVPVGFTLNFQQYFTDIFMITFLTLGWSHWLQTKLRRNMNTQRGWVNTLRPRQSSDLANDIVKYNYSNENLSFFNKLSLKFVPMGPIDNNQVFFQVMAWRRIATRHYLNQWWPSLPGACMRHSASRPLGEWVHTLRQTTTGRYFADECFECNNSSVEILLFLFWLDANEVVHKCWTTEHHQSFRLIQTTCNRLASSSIHTTKLRCVYNILN